MTLNATDLTRSNMQEKLQWAIRSAADIVIKEPVDEHAIKHAFWGYLQAYQQLRFYFGKWVEQTLGKNKKQGNVLLDVWKAKFLNLEELGAWELLNAFRNEDTHTAPIIPDISITEVLLLAEDGAFLLYEDGCFIAAEETQKVIILFFRDTEYNLTEVCQTGLQAMQQFIDTFDQAA